MSQFGNWLKDASVPNKIFKTEDGIDVAADAHTLFVTIHPFIDGNGRVARLLMNLILMRYGFPIAVITREDRLRYYDALEISQSSDITPFISLVSECIDESLEEYEAAAKEQHEATEWAKSLASKFDAKERIQASNRYEVWKNAMDLLKSLFRQTTEMLDESSYSARIFFKDFGVLEFEKYLSLKNYVSAKRTWFFRIDFRSTKKSARYLFFFGSPNTQMRPTVDVTLHISREEPQDSFNYERIDIIHAENIPSIFEIGYNQSTEEFVTRCAGSRINTSKADAICKQFVTDVVEKHFQN